MALSRITQACSWASSSIEVIVRDNSGSPEKRAQIAQFRRDHCTIVSTDPCSPLENLTELMRLANGDFIFCLGDDDLYFDRAIAAMPGVIDRFGRDPAVAAIAGSYIVEASKGSALANYQNIDSDDVTARLAGYLSYPGANVLFYTAQRRAMVERIFHFIKTMPFLVSYHDQIICMLYLLNGKFIKLPNVLYGYDAGPWEEMQSAQKRDVDFYRAAGLDPAINKLHWFMCGFEGAVLIRNSDIFPDHPIAQRQKMADQWFSAMFMRFLNNPRLTFGSSFAAQADAVCEKLRASQGRLSFVDMLIDICQLIAVSSDTKAQTYLSFWGGALKSRTSAPVGA
jgi:hypothetical protein